MYNKNDVLNLIHSDYELTELDERIYNELGLTVHSAHAPKNYPDGARTIGSITYTRNFGSVYNGTYCIDGDGHMYMEDIHFDRWGDSKEIDEYELPERMRPLFELKYEELKNGYWKE